MAKPHLSILKPTTVKGPTPPQGLDESGLSLWRSIQAEYGITDSGGAPLPMFAEGALDGLDGMRVLRAMAGDVWPTTRRARLAAVDFRSGQTGSAVERVTEGVRG